MAGYARTVRYLPLREDLSAAYGAGMNAQKRAIEEIRPGEVLVIEARGDKTAGTIGDILGLRAQVRGAAGIVTDGALRPDWTSRSTTPPSTRPSSAGGTSPGKPASPWPVPG